MDETKTAIHEAGHAVAHVRLGILQDLLTIISDEYFCGAVLSEGVETVDNTDKAERMVLAYCAGFAALVAAGYPTEIAIVGSDDDFEKCSKLIEDWDLRYSLERFKDLAIELMSEPKNVAAVQLVANYALEHKRVEGDVVDVLVELADGDCTSAEFDRYLANRSA
jgi:hypothetical protein